jgi:hypothetical protein
LVSVFLFGAASAWFGLVLWEWLAVRRRVRRVVHAARRDFDSVADAHRAVLSGQAAAFMFDDPLTAAHHASKVLHSRLQSSGKHSAASWVTRAATRLEAVGSVDSSPPRHLYGFSSLELAALLLSALSLVAANLREAGRRHGAAFVALTIAAPIRWHVLDAIEYGALLDPTRPEYRVLNPMVAVTVDGGYPSHRLKE